MIFFLFDHQWWRYAHFVIKKGNNEAFVIPLAKKMLGINLGDQLR